jgi:hypothetical protein
MPQTAQGPFDARDFPPVLPMRRGFPIMAPTFASLDRAGQVSGAARRVYT